MKRLMAGTAYLIIISIIFSCKTLYGVKTQKNINEARINKFYEHLPVKDFKKVIADSAYSSFIKKFYKKDSTQLYYHLQPLQALYFDSQDNLISYHVNCNAGGFPNLQWNRNNIFDIFPAATQTKISHPYSLDLLKKALGIEDQKKLLYDYTVVVFWDLFLEKQSQRLIDQVSKNLTITNKKINLILVNNDNLFLGK